MSIVRFLFFCGLFLVLDFTYLFTNHFKGDYDSLTIAIMNNSIGYNNLYIIVGIVVTVMFVLSLNKISFIKDSSFIVRNGKKNYLKYLVKDVSISATLFSSEFVMAEMLICTIRFKNELLVDTRFYWCCILYAVMLCGYFLTVGISTVLINILCGFSKASYIFSIVLFLAINSLILLNIRISPLYFSQFISDWFTNGYFNYLDYIMNLMKCLCVCLAINYLANIILLRKDLIFNE